MQIMCFYQIAHNFLFSNLTAILLPQFPPNFTWSYYFLTQWVHLLLPLCEWVKSHLLVASQGLHSSRCPSSVSHNSSTACGTLCASPLSMLGFWLALCMQSQQLWILKFNCLAVPGKFSLGIHCVRLLQSPPPPSVTIPEPWEEGAHVT